MQEMPINIEQVLGALIAIANTHITHRAARIAPARFSRLERSLSAGTRTTTKRNARGCAIVTDRPSEIGTMDNLDKRLRNPPWIESDGQRLILDPEAVPTLLEQAANEIKRLNDLLHKLASN
jgi:hypothetical protein